MGGKSSSSSSTASNAYDNRIGISAEGLDGGSIVANSGSGVINMTDPGLIGLAENALSQNERILLEVLEGAANLGIGAMTSIGSNADKAFEFVDKARQDEDQRTARALIPWLVAGASVFAITWAIKR